MKTITRQELDLVLANHLKWLNNENGGVRADLRYADLTGADLTNANLSYADLRDADLSYANLTSAILTYAILRDANLTSANLTSANLPNANLSYAILNSANLTGADLTGANLTGADLTGATLTGANLVNTDIVSFYLGKHFGYYFNGSIKIGCENHPIEFWLKYFKKIGKKHGYSEKETTIYGDMIKLIYETKHKRKSIFSF